MEPFFRDVFSALKADGIFVNQCESMFYHRDFIQGVVAKINTIFPVARYYYTMIPTYPSGNIGFCFASKKYQPEQFRADECHEIQEQLSYYTAEIHNAAFCLPAFMRRTLNGGA
jgi:spermidine synthase